ncbi:MAG: phosphoribosylformylglycinamidine synthase subunit PurS [Sphingomonadaceae bacterium]
MWLAKVHVTLKPVVLDPQGQAIHGGLRSLGFDSVQSVRAGKYLEIKLEAPDREEAERLVNEMCAKLLANPVIEDYRLEVEQD